MPVRARRRLRVLLRGTPGTTRVGGFKDRGGLEDEPEPVPAEDTGVLVRC